VRNTDFDPSYETKPHPITDSALGALQRVLDDPTMDGASILIRAATAALRYAPRIPVDPMPPDKEEAYHDTIRDLMEELGAQSDPRNSGWHGRVAKGDSPVSGATGAEQGETPVPSAQSLDSADPHPTPQEAHGSESVGPPDSDSDSDSPTPPTAHEQAPAHPDTPAPPPAASPCPGWVGRLHSPSCSLGGRRRALPP